MALSMGYVALPSVLPALVEVIGEESALLTMHTRRHRVTLKKRYGLLLTQQKDAKKAAS